MTTLNWDAVEQAGEEYTQIALYMQEAKCAPDEIVDALGTFDRYGNIEHTKVREAMCVNEWPDDLRNEWDGAQEIRDTEYRGHIQIAAD